MRELSVASFERWSSHSGRKSNGRSIEGVKGGGEGELSRFELRSGCGGRKTPPFLVSNDGRVWCVQERRKREG